MARAGGRARPAGGPPNGLPPGARPPAAREGAEPAPRAAPSAAKPEGRREGASPRAELLRELGRLPVSSLKRHQKALRSADGAPPADADKV